MRNNRSLEGEPDNLIMQAGKLDPANATAQSLDRTVATASPLGLRVSMIGFAIAPPGGLCVENSGIPR